jgi:hypothetical protein
LPIFFRTTPQPKASHLEQAVRALANDKVDDPNARVRAAQQVLQQAPAQPSNPPIIWRHVFIAFTLLIALFGVSLWVGSNPHYTRASETLLRCFELLFTATLGLFGIEAAKHG